MKLILKNEFFSQWRLSQKRRQKLKDYLRQLEGRFRENLCSQLIPKTSSVLYFDEFNVGWQHRGKINNPNGVKLNRIRSCFLYPVTCQQWSISILTKFPVKTAFKNKTDEKYCLLFTSLCLALPVSGRGSEFID